MAEINLLDEYPIIKRDTKGRAKTKTKEQVEIAKKFGWEYFDKKGICYDGYSYDGRWTPVAKKFIDYYNLNENSSVLDVGSAKGYLLYDFKQLMPSMRVTGIEISQYAIDCAPPEIKPFIHLGNAKDLSRYKDKEFDLIVCITTIHNLKVKVCRQAVREIQRVGKNGFIKVDAYRNKKDRVRMFDWNITAETVLSVNEWEKLYEEEGYTGDYYWFIP